MSSSDYRTLLGAPGAAAFFLTAAAGRVGIAMTSLGIVWLVHARTGSYATAGLVTGGFAVAEAVAGPQLGRLADRFGQTRVLPPALLAHAGAAVAILLAVVAAGTPDWLMTAAGAAAGATIPQLGALSAARWAALLRGQRAAALPTAFALESLANELAYLAGPALVSILGASGFPAVGTAAAAALVVVTGLCLAAQHRTAPRVQLAVAAAGLAAGCLPLPVAGSPIELGFTIALTGLAIPLILILCSVLAESAVHQTVLTQAFAWLNSASAAGSAGAAAVAGWAVDGRGAPGGFAAAAVAAALMAMLAVTGQRALRVPHRKRPQRSRRSKRAKPRGECAGGTKEPAHPSIGCDHFRRLPITYDHSDSGFVPV